MLNREEIIAILKHTGVMQEGHFLLTSGLHSGQYMQCAKLFIDPEISESICLSLSEYFKNDKIDYVIGPALGGVILAYEMSRALCAKNIFAERHDGNMLIRRGFSIPSGSRVLVVEDVITTGGSVFEVIELVRAAEANLVGVGVVVDRSAGQVDFGVPVHSLIKMDIAIHEAHQCPLCAKKIPLVKPGSRKVIS